jgi:hypothetical protein
MAVRGASQQIVQQLSLWDGVSQHPHRFGGLEFRLGKREIGHIHGDWMLDIPFPTRVRDEIVGLGMAQPHHLLPQTGWVSFYIKEPPDVQRAIDLLRRSYELAQKQRRLKPDHPTAHLGDSNEQSEG